MLGGSGLPPLDLSALLQFVFTALALASGLLFLVKYAASKYFDVDANFAVDSCYEVRERKMSVGRGDDEKCFVCRRPGTKKCSRCKNVRYCSSECQAKHWKEHKLKCKDSKMSNDIASVPSSNITSSNSVCRRRNAFSPAIALVPARGSCKELKQPKKILFPYEEFVKLFNWNKQTFPPCGLLNCGNSCFANVVLQCLSCTRPLVAYLLEEGHSRECSRRDWCFLCELQIHIKKVSQSLQPFSPISILSRLPNIGGNLGYGRQEDAHEFMRFAIDTMQSICLDEYGGEKALDPRTHETTLIHHIFGGLLQSQIICTECNVISNRYENMMDLTVEIQGDAKSLEECLDQFTVKEWLDGENMYRCDGCNDYVKAWKRLTVHQAPNILTIALKRFQSGRFGKLNKRVTFPEILDLGPYMSGAGDGTDVYTLYAVVVHVDMLNASFFGHYICYTKDFLGHWYKIDDCKVMEIEVGEVLAQGAYMLFYSRMSAHQLFVRSLEPIRNHGKQSVQIVSELKRELSSRIDSELKKEEPNDMDLDEPSIIKLGSLTHGKQSVQIVSELKRELSSSIDSELKKEEPEDMDLDEPSIINLGSLAQDSGDADMDFSDTRCLGPKYIDGNTIHLLSHKVPHSESHTAGCQRPCFRSHGDLQFEIENGSSSNSEELLKVADSRDSGALNTASEPLEANPSLSDCYCGPEAEHADSANEIVMLASAVRNHETKALESNKESTAHSAESKPVFSPSSVNKPNIKKSLHHEGRAGLGNGEAVLFSRYNGECNGFLESDNNWDGKSKSSSAASSSTIEGCRVSIPGVSSVAELLEANPPLLHYSSGIKLEKTNAVSGGPSDSANGVSRLGGMLPVARNHETKSPLSSCSDNTTYKGGSKPLLSPGLLEKCVKKTQMQRSGLSSWDRNRPNGVLEYDNCSYVGEVNPQFSPGFLVKQGGNKSLDQEEKFHTENGTGLSCKENGKCNGYVVSKLARQKVQNHEANRDSFCGSDKDTVPDCQLPLISCGFLDKSNGKARKDETSKQDADKNGFESRTNCDGFTDPTFLGKDHERHQ